MILISDDTSKQKSTSSIDYYCSFCKSAHVEKYENGNLRSIDWIDFNV